MKPKSINFMKKLDYFKSNSDYTKYTIYKPIGYLLKYIYT